MNNNKNNNLSKRVSNKVKKEQALINAAYKLFLEKGLHNTSINDIVNEAGVAKGTFYLYFRDKFEIRDRITLRKTKGLIEDALKKVTETDLPTFEDQFIFITDYIIDYLSKNIGLLKFIYKNLSYAVFVVSNEADQPNQNEQKNIYQALYQLYQKHITEESIQIEQPKIVFSFLLELIGSAVYSSIIYGQPIPVNDLKPYLHRSIKAILKEYTKH